MTSSDAVPREESSSKPVCRRMRLRYAGVCRDCAAELPARTEAVYERTTRTVRCLACADALAGSSDVTRVADRPDDVERVSATGSASGDQPRMPDSGVAGASARREHERRKAKDELRLREKWGRWGGLAVALSDERSSTASWARGAVGEERVGAMLDEMVSPCMGVLHDRRVPGSRANIDHLVVTSEAVFVVDPKRYKGRPALRVEGGVLRPRVEKLIVAGRDRTSLVDGMVKQVAVVKDAVGEGVPVRGVLCFVDSDWPLLGSAFVIRDVTVLWPRRLRKLLSTASDPSGPVDVAGVTAALALRLPPA